ncbi:MAG: hypothetical protein HRT38_17735 [Alteromonadaceae bacterium]|nr:hypothetical protein [Alteromonadaceae bacterium]
MSRPTLEIADIFHRYGNKYRQNHQVGLSPDQSKVMGAIEASAILSDLTFTKIKQHF